jgi:MarR family transcriptional regulator, negative regulator of the multidrug operon emrRAB
MTESVIIGVMREELTANWLGALASAVDGGIAEAAAEHSRTAMAAVLTLSYFPDTTVGELADVLGLTGSGAVRLLDRLGRDGLVRRYAGQGRSVMARLTDDGRQLAENLQRRRLHTLEGILAPLTDDERRQFTTLVGKILRHAALPADRARTVCRLCDHMRCDGDACPVGGSLRDNGEAPPRAGVLEVE